MYDCVLLVSSMLNTMVKLLFLVILANLFIFSSGQSNNCSTNVECPDALNRFTEKLLVVCTRALQSFINSTTCDTGSLSPLGILFNLMGLALFAEGATKNETYTTLNLRSREEIICVANIVNNESYYLPDCIEFAPATDFFANKQYQFTPDFKGNMSDIIVGKAINLDFNNPVSATNTINSQVASQTGNRITNVILDSSMISSSTEIVSITAVFMTGTWQIGMQCTDQVTEFRVSPTKSEPQTFLYQDAVYLYGHSDILQAQVAQINFCCEAFYMWEILPDCPFTEDALIKTMALNTDWYYELLENMKPTRLDFYVPRYNRSTTVNTKDVFGEASGLKTVYDDKTIDLKGAIEGDCPAAVTVGVQTTYIATGFEGGPVPKVPQSQGPKKIFKIDSPHVWLIFRNGRVHFIGTTRSQVS